MTRILLTAILFAMIACLGVWLAVDSRQQREEAAHASTYTHNLQLNAANGAVPLHVELAVTGPQQERGLMYRTSLNVDQGMLFIFPDSQNRAFWMKNTRIPLDLIFLDADRKIVHIAHDAQPEDETLIPSQQPAAYVLEVLGGQAVEWGLADGDTAEGEAFSGATAVPSPAATPEEHTQRDEVD